MRGGVAGGLAAGMASNWCQLDVWGAVQASHRIRLDVSRFQAASGRDGLPREVARRQVAAGLLLQRRLDLRADLPRDRAARAEAAARRRVDRAGHVAAEHDAAPPPA